VLRDIPHLRGVGRLTLRQSLGCARLVLWDEADRRLVSFREVRARYGRHSALPIAGSAYGG
jgi:omega-6 fatty acid desaturase (delta-12 desaturase)